MPLPESMRKLRELGKVSEECVISDVKFKIRSMDTKEYNEILAVTANVSDPSLRVELVKHKTLEIVIESVDGQKVDPAEMMEWLKQCNPTIINTLFNKYLEVADKAAVDVDKSVNKATLADTNLPNLMGNAAE